MKDDAGKIKEQKKRGINYSFTIQHGIPVHSYFVIFMPKFAVGGLINYNTDVGFQHNLFNPKTEEITSAELVGRDVVYTANSAFDMLAYSAYGVPGYVVLEKMLKQYPDMVDTCVEVWIFKKE